jgi:hypothetical protein
MASWLTSPWKGRQKTRWVEQPRTGPPTRVSVAPSGALALAGVTQGSLRVALGYILSPLPGLLHHARPNLVRSCGGEPLCSPVFEWGRHKACPYDGIFFRHGPPSKAASEVRRVSRPYRATSGGLSSCSAEDAALQNYQQFLTASGQCDTLLPAFHSTL